MSQRKEFKHVFRDLSAKGMLSIETDTTGNQRIKIDLEKDGKIWLSANKAGWLHLAKICAELGMGDYEPGYHFHKSLDFKSGDGREPEISFEISEQ